MAQIVNVSFNDFRKDAENKKIVLWGAGKLADYYIKNFCKGLNIVGVVDQNKAIHGTCLKSEGDSYYIMDENWLKDIIKNNIGHYRLFITPTAYAGQIIAHLNDVKGYNELICYVGVLLRDFYEPQNFEFTMGIPLIPKVIHYCWFGTNDIPDHLKKYMETWKKYCPDYEIKRWDESNYDITKNRYMKEAYEAKKWGFVPDYARLDIIYNEGGIYLDTDVELLQNPDKLLNCEMFMGFGGNFQINFGAGFGAVKKHPLIKQLRDYYDDLCFNMGNGKLNLKTCYEYQHPVLQEYGFTLINKYQKINDVVLYPSEVLSPNTGLISQNYTENTISVHHCEYSWASDAEKKAYNQFKEDLKVGRINYESKHYGLYTNI